MSSLNDLGSPLLLIHLNLFPLDINSRCFHIVGCSLFYVVPR